MHYKFHLIIITLPYIKLSKEVQATITVDFYIIILKNQYSNSKKKKDIKTIIQLFTSQSQ